MDLLTFGTLEEECGSFQARSPCSLPGRTARVLWQPGEKHSLTLAHLTRLQVLWLLVLACCRTTFTEESENPDVS